MVLVPQDHGKCPVTKDELAMDDLVTVKTNNVRPANCFSFLQCGSGVYLVVLKNLFRHQGLVMSLADAL